MHRTEDIRVAVRLGAGSARFWLTLHEAPASGEGDAFQLVGITLEGHAAEDATFSILVGMLAKEATAYLEGGGEPQGIVDRWLMTSFAPRGAVSDEARGVRFYAHSVTDWAAREIGARYCGRGDLVGLQ